MTAFDHWRESLPGNSIANYSMGDCCSVQHCIQCGCIRVHRNCTSPGRGIPVMQRCDSAPMRAPSTTDIDLVRTRRRAPAPATLRRCTPDRERTLYCQRIELIHAVASYGCSNKPHKGSFRRAHDHSILNVKQNVLLTNKLPTAK